MKWPITYQLLRYLLNNECAYKKIRVLGKSYFLKSNEFNFLAGGILFPIWIITHQGSHRIEFSLNFPDLFTFFMFMFCFTRLQRSYILLIKQHYNFFLPSFMFICTGRDIPSVLFTSAWLKMSTITSTPESLRTLANWVELRTTYFSSAQCDK